MELLQAGLYSMPIISPSMTQISLLCRELNCGNHLCELTCHPLPCPACELLPSNVTSCPCGATPLSLLLSPDQSRTSCLDPVPTCRQSCGKKLSCSTRGLRNYFQHPYTQNITLCVLLTRTPHYLEQYFCPNLGQGGLLPSPLKLLCPPIINLHLPL